MLTRSLPIVALGSIIISSAVHAELPSPSKPFLGLAVVESKDAIEAFAKKKARKPTANGLVVAATYNDGPAAKLQLLDVITAIDGQPVTTMEDFNQFKKTLVEGQTYKIRGHRLHRTRRSQPDWRTFQDEITATTIGKFALGCMKSEPDEVRELVIYKNKRDPEVDGATHVGLYLSREKAGGVHAFLRFQYAGEDWIFADTFVVKFPDSAITLKAGHFDVSRDNSGGHVWEWIDFPVDGDAARVVDKLASKEAGKVIVRFQGRQTIHDHELSEEEVERIYFGMIAKKALEEAK